MLSVLVGLVLADKFEWTVKTTVTAGGSRESRKCLYTISLHNKVQGMVTYTGTPLAHWDICTCIQLSKRIRRLIISRQRSPSLSNTRHTNEGDQQVDALTQASMSERCRTKKSHRTYHCYSSSDPKCPTDRDQLEPKHECVYDTSHITHAPHDAALYSERSIYRI